LRRPDETVPNRSNASAGKGKTTALRIRVVSESRFAAVAVVAVVVWMVTLIGVGAGVRVIVGDVQLIPYCDGRALFTVCPFTVALTLEQMNVTWVPTAVAGGAGPTPLTGAEPPGAIGVAWTCTFTGCGTDIPVSPEVSVADRTTVYIPLLA
jgi:hypothetical protein